MFTNGSKETERMALGAAKAQALLVEHQGFDFLKILSLFYFNKLAKPN